MNVPPRTLRMLPLAVATLILSACGEATLLAGTVPVHMPAHASAPATTHPTLTPAPVAAQPAPAVTPPPVAPPPAPPVSTTFAIQPLFSGGAAGSITATSTAAGVHLHLVISRLVAGSVHAIHDHRGSCSAASTSTHLSVLGILRADASGVIAFDANVPASQYGSGRIVIVYDRPTPALITGCASI